MRRSRRGPRQTATITAWVTGATMAALVLGACGGPVPSSGTPEPDRAAPAAPQTAAEAAAAAAAALTDSLMREHLRRELAAGLAIERIDTIVVSPAQRVLLLGDELDLRSFALEARDSSGARLPAFAPIYVLAPSESVAPVTRTRLRGVMPGRAVFYVEAFPRDSARPWQPLRPSTRVEILVRPR